MNDTAQLLREAARQLNRYIESTKRRDIETLGRYITDSSHALPEKLMKAAASLQAQEPVVYWVLYDSTGEKKYIKKSLGDGSLAFFDTEAEAKRAQRWHGPGVAYKRIEYYRHPPTSAVPEGFLEGAQSFKSEMLKASKAMLHPFIEGVFAVWELNSAAPQQHGGSDSE